LLEANRCGGVDPVPVKTVEQQTLQVLHRVRTQWQAARTARINAMRGTLREFGFPIGVGARTALKRIPALLEDATIALPELVRQTVWVVLQEARDLEVRIATIDQQLVRLVREHAVARRLVQIPGVGVITATALIGAVGHIRLSSRPALRQLAGAHAARIIQWWAATSRRHQQTRGRLSPLSVDARRALRLAEGATHGPNGAESGDALSAVGR